MKSLIFTCIVVLFSVAGFSQTTYYWVGGVGPAVIHGTSANWNTQLNGSGTPRSAAAVTDILIFDGTNIGGAVPSTGTVTATAASQTIGQLILQNGANIIMQRTGLPTGTGTSAITIGGNASAPNDLIIDATSSLKITSITASYGFTLVLATGATGTIAGNLSMIDGGIFTSRFYVRDANALNFEGGSKCFINNTVAGNYPFGSLATAVATGGINFKSGSQLIYQGGVNPYSSATFIPFYFETGSTFIFEAAAVANMFVSHTLANVIVRNNATVTAENFYNIDTLTVEAGSTFYTRISGVSPFSGNIINNGTFGAAAGFTSAHLLLDGIVPQSIGGTGTFTDVGTFSVGTDADVTLNTNIAVGGSSTSTISGMLNTQTYTISGTSDFQLRPSATATSNGTLTSGSNTVALDPAVFTTGINTANVSIGAHVTGTGISANTYIIATNSTGSSFTISKPATVTTGPLAASITITNNPATLATAHPSGADGSITTTGARTFGTGTHYIFDAATTTPFTASSANATGNVSFNAAVTTNKTRQNINGTLTLNAGKLTIRNTDTLRITSGNAIAGAPFSSSKYIITEVLGNNLGVLRIDNLPTSTTLFPVGSASYYLPVSLTPENTVDHAVSVFEGVTEDGTPTGTPFTAAKKANIADAAWIINRPTGSGNCVMQTQWDAALEGSNFMAYSNGAIGISRHNGTEWGICLGTGDNAANTATALYSSFSPFSVGFNGAILASQVKSIAAFIKANAVEITWHVSSEAGIQLYEIEKSINKVDFMKIGSVNATGNNKYDYTDIAALNGVVYYRLKIISSSGNIKYSDMVMVKKNGSNEISLYPNPVVNALVLSGLTNPLSYRIINAAGQMMIQQKTTANSLSIDISNLQGGLYFIEILSTDNSTIKQSFIKQ